MACTPRTHLPGQVHSNPALPQAVPNVAVLAYPVHRVALGSGKGGAPRGLPLR